MKFFFLLLLSFSTFAETKYHNPGGDHLHGMLDILKWKWTSNPAKWPESIPNKEYPLSELSESDRVSATFINHASYLLRFDGLTVITDPIYSERASPFTFAGPKRVRQPGLAFEALPIIDVVIISHNHYDHMNLETLKKLDEKFHPLFLVPMGNEKFLKAEGLQNVKELDWWEIFRVKETDIALVPSQHWSARGLFDKNDTLWGGYTIAHPKAKVYFAGDTGYGPHFRETTTRLGGQFDLALLPIGAYEPRWFMKHHHMNPEEALQAHKDLNATTSLAMHFGTFQLTDEAVDEPVKAFEIAREKMQVKAQDFRVLDQGESLAIH